MERSMKLALVKGALQQTYSDVLRNHTMQMAAALSYYFVLSLFPALIFLSAVVAYLPVPDLFGQALGIMGRFIPPDSMGLVRRVLADVITPNRGTFLSFGILGTLWAASGGFAATIEALNIAYDVREDRPFWKTRPLAIALAFVIGGLMLLALAIMIVDRNSEAGSLAEFICLSCSSFCGPTSTGLWRSSLRCSPWRFCISSALM
jgi:membrane protein